MKALFCRKLLDLEELLNAIDAAKKRGVEGTEYTVDRKVELKNEDFKEFCNDFLKDQPWIKNTDGGNNEKGQLRCIRVTNIATGESFPQRGIFTHDILRLRRIVANGN